MTSQQRPDQQTQDDRYSARAHEKKSAPQALDPNDKPGAEPANVEKNKRPVDSTL